MKRIGAIVCLAIIMAMATATSAFATGFEVTQTSPKDEATGAAVDNMGVKVYFNEEVYNKNNEAANKKLCTLTDAKGKKVTTKIVFTKKDPKVMLVLADTKAKIKGETKYSMTIEEGFKSASGDELKEAYTTSFTTQNPRGYVRISMAMMFIMFGAIIVVMVRETTKPKDDKEKKKNPFKKEEKNPYKEAKKKGKSVEEIIDSKDKKDARKREAEERKQQKIRARGDKREAKRIEKENSALKKASIKTLKTKKPAPISEAGSTYRDKETLEK